MIGLFEFFVVVKHVSQITILINKINQPFFYAPFDSFDSFEQAFLCKREEEIILAL